MKINRMKSRLLAGEPALGCSIMVPSPQMVEMIGRAGFDWVLIDLEHGTIDLETAELMIMAAEASDVTPIARPRSNRKEDISSVMDRGAMGVQVPHVNTAEDARQAVDAVKFGAGDRRGLAAGTRPDGYGLSGSMADFVDHSNAQSLVCVQLEHAAAIDNLDDILEVEDIDVFFIGPSDLSQSMGHPGDPGAGPVAAAIEGMLQKIRAAGRIPGMPAAANNVDAVLGKGVKYIYTHLPKLVAAGSAEFLTRAGKT
ncbi:MAG: aldolase/citrate lyase family protein [Gammaproteobacteria bacterium]|jgi:4-hydroxy-2-oxoheptanedioate aldolase